MGAIVAEFLTIHQDSYVVRALAQSGGITLASGMASAPAIEAAEDRAKIRALEALGIRVAPSFDLPVAPIAEPVSPAIAAIESAPFSQPAALSTSPSLELEFAASQPIDSPSAEPLLAFPLVDRSPEFSLESVPEPLPDPIAAPEPYKFPLESVEPDQFSPEPLPEPPAVKPSKSKRKTESASIPPVAETSDDPAPELSQPSPEPTDRSNEIAKISVEMKRLGWTTEQGRRHLKETYGKRSRQELNDSELMDFLGYLETQPSSAQSLF
jgi:hypothetical protein